MIKLKQAFNSLTWILRRSKSVPITGSRVLPPLLSLFFSDGAFFYLVYVPPRHSPCACSPASLFSWPLTELPVCLVDTIHQSPKEGSRFTGWTVTLVAGAVTTAYEEALYSIPFHACV